VRLRPDVGEGHHQLGLAFVRSGRLAEGLPHLAEAVRLDPQLPASRNDYGLALSQSGHGDEARAQYVEALRLNPDQPESHNNLGSLLAADGKFADAAREFEAAVRVAPDYVQGRMNLAPAHYRLNKVDEALQIVGSAEGEPNNEQAKAAAGWRCRGSSTQSRAQDKPTFESLRGQSSQKILNSPETPEVTEDLFWISLVLWFLWVRSLDFRRDTTSLNGRRDGVLDLRLALGRTDAFPRAENPAVRFTSTSVGVARTRRPPGVTRFVASSMPRLRPYRRSSSRSSSVLAIATADLP
jgi:hypothetical protein